MCRFRFQFSVLPQMASKVSSGWLSAAYQTMKDAEVIELDIAPSCSDPPLAVSPEDFEIDRCLNSADVGVQTFSCSAHTSSRDPTLDSGTPGPQQPSDVKDVRSRSRSRAARTRTVVSFSGSRRWRLNGQRLKATDWKTESERKLKVVVKSPQLHLTVAPFRAPSILEINLHVAVAPSGPLVVAKKCEQSVEPGIRYQLRLRLNSCYVSITTQFHYLFYILYMWFLSNYWNRSTGEMRDQRAKGKKGFKS